MPLSNTVDDPNDPSNIKTPAFDPENPTGLSKNLPIPASTMPTHPDALPSGSIGNSGGTPADNATGYFSPKTTVPTANGAGNVGAIGAANANLSNAALARPVVAEQGSVSGYGASAAGAAHSVTAGAATAGRVDSVSTSVDPATGTVQGQLAGIIDANSPLLQRAVARANQQSNDRGLLNSTQNITAGQAALYDAAMPIATADANAFNTTRLTNQASTNAGSTTNAQLYTTVSQSNVQSALQAGIVTAQQADDIAKFNANSANEAGRFNAASANDMSKFNVQQLLQAGIINQDQANRMSALNATQANANSQFNAGQQNNLTGLSAQLNNDVSKFNASQSNDLIKMGMTSDTQKSVANIEANYRTLMQTSSSAAGLYSQAMGQIALIMGNKDLIDTAKTTAMNNILKMLNSGLAIQGKMGGMNLGGLLTFDNSPFNSSKPATNPATNPNANSGPLFSNDWNKGLGGNINYPGAIGSSPGSP